jgi:8-oxo-dGTP pyrophosphatase MutT (NUDIX family)
VRREDLPEHPGQVSLPGGRPHAGEDLWTTALREAREENGHSSQGVERLGALAPVFIPVSHSVLCVHVALGRDPGALRPCPREVQSIALAGLDDLADPRCRRVVERQVGGRPVPVPTIQVAGVLLWGATAMALGELAARLASARDG